METLFPRSTDASMVVQPMNGDGEITLIKMEEVDDACTQESPVRGE